MRRGLLAAALMAATALPAAAQAWPAWQPNQPQKVALMKPDGRHALVPVVINGVALTPQLDTGADLVCLSPADAETLIAKGRLTDADIIDEINMGDANGGIKKMKRVNLIEIELGGYLLTNVTGSVGCKNSLFGQTALGQLSWYRIDNDGNTLVLGPPKPQVATRF